MITKIKTLLEIRSHFVDRYVNDEYTIQNTDYIQVLQELNIPIPSSKNTSIKFLKDIDIKINELTTSCIDIEINEIKDHLEKLHVDDVEGNEKNFQEILMEQKTVLLDDIKKNHLVFSTLLKKEIDAIDLKYNDYNLNTLRQEKDKINDLKNLKDSIATNLANNIYDMTDQNYLNILNQENLTPPSSLNDARNLVHILETRITTLETTLETTLNSDTLFDIKILSGPSFSLQDGQKQSLNIANSVNIGIQDSLSFSAGTYSDKNLRIPNVENTSDFNNISIRKGNTNSYNYIGNVFNKRTAENFSYRFGSTSSKFYAKESIRHATSPNKFSYTKTKFNTIVDFKSFYFSNTNRVMAFGLEYEKSIMFFGIGAMYVTWAPVQLSIWGYFGLFRLLNVGSVTKELAAAGIDITYKSLEQKEKAIFESFKAGTLSAHLMLKYQNLINKENRKLNMQTGGVNQTTAGVSNVNVVSLQLLGKNNKTIKNNSKSAVKRLVVTPKETAASANFARATLSVIAYGLIGGALSAVGELVRRFAPNLDKRDDTAKPSSSDSASDDTIDAITGYQPI
jgi:hypothetical protein